MKVSFFLYLLFSFFYKGTTRSRHFVEVALEVQSNRPRRRVGWAVVILKCVIPRSTIIGLIVVLTKVYDRDSTSFGRWKHC